VVAVGVGRLKQDVTRIINQTQLIVTAAEMGKPDVVMSALSHIELITAQMKRAVVLPLTAKPQ
jgi:hypothetical protein